jgi:tetratricopeptide (TPR) repeat protein
MEKDSSIQRQDQIAETTRIVLQVIDSYRQTDKVPMNRFLTILQLITRNWVVCIFLLSVISAVIGWMVFDISIFQPLEEISAKQEDYRRKEREITYRQRMVKRHINLANSFLNVSQLEAARIEFENALKLDPFNIDAHLGKLKAEVFVPIANNEYDPEIAEKKLNLLMEERPNDPNVLSFLGMVYMNISKELAMECYRKAISNDPSIASAYIGMALIYDMDKNNEEAIRMYGKALSLSKWNQVYINNLGYQYIQRKNYNSAIEKYDLLLRLNSRYLLSYYTISNAYRIEGYLDNASWYQERLIQLLNDDKIISLSSNRQEWFFHTDTRTIYFDDFSMKKCYAYYNAALTTYLLRDEKKADSYLTKAKNTNTPNEWLVKELLRYDIKELKEAQKKYSRQLDSFIEKYF